MTVPKRSEIPEDLTWDLTRVFKTDSDWEKAYSELENEISTLPELEKDFVKNGKNLYESLTKIFSTDRKLEKIYVYASMSSDVDTSDNHYLGYVTQAQSLVNSYMAAISFVNSDILSLSEETLKKFYQDEPHLNNYRHYLDQILDGRDHVLPAKQEELIAQAGGVLESSSNTFNVLSNSDLEFPYIEDEDGQAVQLTESSYNLFIQSQDRDVRQDAFEALYSSYAQFENTFASTLTGNVKSHNFSAKAHHYKSAREAALSANNIPVSVYDSLIKSVHEHMNLMHRYVALRKKALGLKDMQMWDMYVPMTGKPALSYNFEDAKKEALKALAPLGEDYLKHVEYIFNNRVIDPMENQNKQSGAYSGGSYDTDAYELLNWQNDIDSLYTLVHETGHSVHSMYTRENQPYVYGDYPIFVAEIASTTNENILTEYFLDHVTDPKTRAFILNYYLDSFKGTVYRQTQFAEFEQYIHEEDQKGTPLTAEMLDEYYGNLNQYYYGDAMTPRSDIALEWARIPHFYYDFYVYQYATGFAAATALANNVVHGTDKQREAYLNFLKSGSSDFPIEIMKKAGVDMTKTDYLDEAFKVFEQRLDELESLLDK